MTAAPRRRAIDTPEVQERVAAVFAAARARRLAAEPAGDAEQVS